MSRCFYHSGHRVDVYIRKDVLGVLQFCVYETVEQIYNDVVVVCV